MKNESIRDIDARLNGAGQEAMRNLVRELPEDSLSMAWRSSLNERILAEEKAKARKSRWTWALRPAFGLACAGALAFVFVFHAPMSRSRATAAKPSIESELLTAHAQSSVFADVAEAGLRPSEASYVARQAPDSDVGWTEVDIESL